LVVVGAFFTARIVLSTLVFPFWNLIREDVFEDVIIIPNDGGTCYVDSNDNVPTIIEHCYLNSGDQTTIKYGEGLAWATIVTP